MSVSLFILKINPSLPSLGEPDHGEVTDEEEMFSSSLKTNPAMTYIKDHTPHTVVSVEVLVRETYIKLSSNFVT